MATEGETGRSDPGIDTLWRVHALINDWIRVADAKAGAILLTDAAVITVGMTLFRGGPGSMALTGAKLPLALVAVSTFAFSAVLALICLMPRLATTRPAAGRPGDKVDPTDGRSLIYFRHIATFPTPEAYAAAVVALDDPRAARSRLSHEVWENARVCNRKYEHVMMSAILLVIGVISGALAVFAGGVN